MEPFYEITKPFIFPIFLLYMCKSTFAGSNSDLQISWKGDFETGDLSQWSSKQWMGPDRIQIVQDPVRQGKYAVKVTVKQGDDPIGASGNRNELVRKTNESEGMEYYYSWRTMFAADYPYSTAYQNFTQWHHNGCCGVPPINFSVCGDVIRLTICYYQGSSIRQSTVWSAPLQKSKWYDFVFHAKWSSQQSVGFVELYVNQKLVLPKRNVPTLYPGMTNYLKQGLYRKETIQPDGVVYHDGMVQATTLEEAIQSSSTIEFDRMNGAVSPTVIRVFPDIFASSTIMNIFLNRNYGKNLFLKITDAQGRLVKKTGVSGNQGEKIIVFKNQGLCSGVYHATLQGRDLHVIGKFCLLK